jgi:anti-sigma regulatory factor (Ser/Thr protein kinase)
MSHAPGPVTTQPETPPAPAPLPVRTSRQRPGPAVHTTSLILDAADTAPSRARATLRDTLAQWGLRHLAPDAAAITSELVANAVAASRLVAGGDAPARITLWMAVQDEELCLRVWDPDPVPPPRDHTPDTWDESGRGLMIVQALSHHWDWHPAANSGKYVRAFLSLNEPLPAEDADQIAVSCSCGFTELADETIIDHLLQVFEPADLRGNDGQVHQERDKLTCACGLTAITPDELDHHLLKSWTPANATARDGQQHEARGAD